MKKSPSIMVLTLVATAVGMSFKAYSQEAEADESNAQQVEVINVLGSRAKTRSVADSPVPVDVISGEEFAALGSTADVTDNLKALVPSYTATPATGDGSAYVRPTSLRGLAPDQTLVLVNGKRRHRSALIHFFAPAAGNGAHGPDIGMIPGIAIGNVQVLRDGAAAQYGSDAIAGVINFSLKENSEGGTIEVQRNEHYEGEDSYRASGNLGLPFGEDGFFSISAEIWKNDYLSRGNQRPDAQALIDAGVQGVGADDPTGNGLAQTWGRTATEGLRTFVNAEREIGDGYLYFFGNYADTAGHYRFFYRGPTHSAITAFYANNPELEGLWPAGFTPMLDGDQKDHSLTIGYEGEFDNELTYDFSASVGRNQLLYSCRDGLNPDLPLLNITGLDDQFIQRDFFLGGYEQKETNFNADFTKPISSSMAIAFGAEWREESYEIIAGEENATVGSGTTGYTPATAAIADTFTRDNYAVYTDLEYDVSDEWLVQAAIRYEDFSDFGSTLNWKLATRYDLTDTTILRGAVSTGFHAPTPGQSNIQTVITTFDGSTGLLTLEGLVQSNSEAAASVGGTGLTEETSFNISAGITTELFESVDLSVDLYTIEVNDRIYRTGDIANPNGGGTISFYTNAMDIRSSGIDIVANTDVDWGDSYNTSFIFALNHNQLEVLGQKEVGGILPVSESIIEDIENNYPDTRFTFTTNTKFSDKLNLMVRANYYGAHYDERGTINDTSGNRSWEISPTVFVDVEAGYNITDSTRVVLGFANILDQYPDEIPDDGVHANRQSVGLPYPRRTPVNYEGGSVYLKVSYNF